jgi:hypothetical protein
MQGVALRFEKGRIIRAQAMRPGHGFELRDLEREVRSAALFTANKELNLEAENRELAVQEHATVLRTNSPITSSFPQRRTQWFAASR